MRVGLLIPLQGVAGLWGPSCEACARLAAADINAGRGVLGRPLDLVVIDAGHPRAAVARALRQALTDEAPIEALVGMHLSDLRAFVAGLLPPDLPYVYTPIYEGGETARHVFAIGETPERLLRPGIEWVAERRRAERWFLLGNDYVWPAMMHRRAAPLVRAAGGRLVDADLISFGLTDFTPILERIRAARPDVVLMSLIGEDAVMFNRAFAASGLARGTLRLSCAVEENVLYGIGAENTENMYLGASYFAHLRSAENDAFRERYHGAYGEAPPVQNDHGQSCYEGLHYLAALVNQTGMPSAKAMRAVKPPAHRSARYAGAGAARARKIHVAATDGLDLRVVHSR